VAEVRARRTLRLGSAQQDQGDCGYREGDRVDEDRERRADDLDKGAGEARTADLRDRRARRRLLLPSTSRSTPMSDEDVRADMPR
jgi:hypothetical protein